MAAEFSCTEQQLAAVLALVGDDDKAASICSTYDVALLGPAGAVLKGVLLGEEGTAAVADGASTSLNVFFLLVSAYLVFLMQAGFAMLCAGMVRSKNTVNILLKNVMDACAGAIIYYLIGYGFAYGTNSEGTSNPFIGTGDFALSATASASDSATTWQSFLFQWAFAAATATIVSGAVAERCSFGAYLGYTLFMTGFVYPVASHWVWAPQGWLSAFNPEPFLGQGAYDFAGSGVVHMVGGFAALSGALVIGPRLGRFGLDGKPVSMPAHNVPLVVLGTFILWFGWYGFNPGSWLVVSGNANATVVARTAVTTTLGGAAGGVVGLVVGFTINRHWGLLEVCNGALAGLVAITASCALVQPWAALIIGGSGALVCAACERLLLVAKIDDVVSAFPVHGGSGAWGVLMAGLFATPQFVGEVYGHAQDTGKFGAFYGGNGKLFAAQLVEVLALAAWTFSLMFGFFFILKMLGWARVSEEEETAGLDVSKHGGSAYVEVSKAMADVRAHAA